MFPPGRARLSTSRGFGRTIQQRAVVGDLGIEGDLNRLGMGPVIVVSGVRNVAAGVTYPRLNRAMREIG